MSPFARAWENPVVFRTIVSELTRRRLACILGFFHVALGVLLLAFLAQPLGEVDWRVVVIEIGWGRYAHAILQAGIFGLLVLLVPLRLTRVIDAVRREGCFDEVVASGISPHRIAAGGVITGAGYAGLLLATTIPYVVFCFLLGDLPIGEVAAAYGVQIAYAMIVILFAVAAAILLGARAASGVSVLFAGAGVLALLDVPPVAAWFTPVRFFLGPILSSTAGNAYAAARVKAAFGYPMLYLNEVPAWAYGPGLWILFALAALCILLAGPAHDFRRGLDSFGGVRSGRRTRRLGLLPRFAPLARRIEVAFLYRNLPARWATSRFRLRGLALCAVFLIFSLVGIGVAYAPDLLERVPTQRIALRGLVWIVAPVVILDILAVQGAGLRRRTEGIGPIRGSRGAWWDLFFLLSLGLSALLAFGLVWFESTAGPRALGERRMEDFPLLLAWGFEALGLFLVELHLLARALSHIFVLPSRVRMICIVIVSAALLVPLLFLEPLCDAGILGDWVRTAIGLFPIPAITGAVATSDIFSLPLFVPLHGSLVSALIGLNLILGLRARRLLAGAIGLSILFGLAAPPALAGDGSIDLRVIPGIGGLACPYSPNPLIVEISNHGSEAVRGDLRMREREGPEWTLLEGIEVSPGSMLRRRILARWDGKIPHAIEFTGDRIRATQSLLPTDVAQVDTGVIHIDAGPRALALAGPNGKLPLPFAPIRSEYLPDASLAYRWVALVVLGDADPNDWEPAQVGALEGYVRAGGTLAISGGGRPAAFYSSRVIARWIGNLPAPREGDPPAREIPFGLGRIVLCAIDLADPSIDDSLRVRVAERVLAEHWEALSEGWEDDIRPRQWPTFLGWLLTSDHLHGLSDFKIPAAFWLLYSACLVMAGALAVRRGRLSGFRAIGVTVVLFSAAATGAFWVLERSPSPAAVVCTCMYEPSALGAELITCQFASAGRTNHRITVVAPNVELYSLRGPSWRVLDSRQDLRAVSLDVCVPRWRNRGVFGTADPPGPPPLRIRAVWKKPEQPATPVPGETIPAGTVEVRIERNPEYAGPMPIAPPPPEAFSEFARKELGHQVPMALWAIPEDPSESGPRATLSAYGLQPWVGGKSVAALGAVLRGEVAVVEFAVEQSIPSGRSRGRGSTSPPRLTIEYCMPPETGPKVEGEGLAFETPIRLIQQGVRIEEEP